MQKDKNQGKEPKKDKKKYVILILIIFLLLWFVSKFILNVSFEIVGNEKDGYGLKVEKQSILIIGEPYSYILYEDHVKLLEYMGWDEEIWVPDKIAGRDVTIIGEDCFVGVWNTIFKVTLHDKIEVIEKNAFWNSPKLWGVLGGTNVKVVGENAFAECEMLSVLELGENLEAIEENAFFHCVNLKELSPQQKLVRIERGAFAFSGLETFIFNENAVWDEDAFMETTWQSTHSNFPTGE